MAYKSGIKPAGSSDSAVDLCRTGRSHDDRSWDCALDPCRPVFQVVRKMRSGPMLSLSYEMEVEQESILLTSVNDVRSHVPGFPHLGPVNREISSLYEGDHSSASTHVQAPGGSIPCILVIMVSERPERLRVAGSRRNLDRRVEQRWAVRAVGSPSRSGGPG